MTTISRSRTIILGGTKDQARACAIRRGIKSDEWIYCGRNGDVFRGRRSPRVITTGTWTQRSDLVAIQYAMRAANVKPEDVTNDPF
jgi:hypothetical protein